MERLTFSPSTEICPSGAPTSRLRSSPATCAAESPAPAARDGSTVISTWRPALTRSLFTFARLLFAARVSTSRSDAASTSAPRSPVMMMEIAFDPAAKPISSTVTVQPPVPTGARISLRRSFATARSVEGSRITVMRAAFGARPVMAAVSVWLPVALSPGIDVVTSSTSASRSSSVYAWRLRSRTR